MSDLRTTAARMARASIGLGITTVWSALLGLFTTPFLIDHLGTSRYGLFALISVVSSYLSNLEFGFGHATIRFLARANARGDIDEARAVFGTGLTIFVVGALVACATTFVGASFIVRHFAHGPAGLHSTFVTSVELAAPIIAVSMLTSFTGASLQALERFGYLIAAPWIIGTLMSIMAVTVVALGGSLPDVIAGQLVLNSLLLLTNCLGLLSASLTTAHPRFSRSTFKSMGRYSLWLMLAGVASQTMFQGPPLVLASYKLTSELAVFAVANTIFQQLTGIVGAAGIGFLPYVSAASIGHDHSEVAAVYAANLRMTLLVLSPIVAFIGVFAHPLLGAWISNAFAVEASTPLRLMLVASLVVGLGSAPGDLARGFGMPALVTGYTVVASVAILAVAFAAVPTHGASGAAFGLCAGLTITTIPFIFIVGNRIIGLSPRSLMRSLVGPCAALVVVFVLYECGRLVADTFVSAVVTGAAGTSIYVALAATVFLDSRERRVFLSVFERLRTTVAHDPEA